MQRREDEGDGVRDTGLVCARSFSQYGIRNPFDLDDG